MKTSLKKLTLFFAFFALTSKAFAEAAFATTAIEEVGADAAVIGVAVLMVLILIYVPKLIRRVM